MEWRTVKGFEGVYELRNDGLLYSHPRKGTKGGFSYGTDKGDGYLKYRLCSEWKTMHKLVYETFIGPIPKGYDVHHKNHNKHNNFVYVNEDGSVDLEKSNLELIEKYKHHKMHYEENSENFHKANIEKCSKTVLQFTLEGDFIAEYPSVVEAEKQNGIYHQNISKCCKGYLKTAGGFVWKYKETAA